MDSGFDVDEPHPLLRSAKEMIIAGFHTSAELMVGVLFINLRCWITERLIETLYSSSSWVYYPRLWTMTTNSPKRNFFTLQKSVCYWAIAIWNPKNGNGLKCITRRLLTKWWNCRIQTNTIIIYKSINHNLQREDRLSHYLVFWFLRFGRKLKRTRRCDSTLTFVNGWEMCICYWIILEWRKRWWVRVFEERFSICGAVANNIITSY